MPPLSNDDSDTLWKLKLYPNGYNSDSKNFISLFLEAIPTRFELINNIKKRVKTFKMGIGRFVVHENMESFSNRFIGQEMLNSTFEFENNYVWGRAKFCKLNNIFLNEDRTKELDILIQVTFMNEENFDDDEIMSESTEGYFEKNIFTDIEFALDCGSRVKAHRIILSMKSAYFKNMLEGGWREQGMDVIPIKNVRYEAFRAILYYIYSNKLMEVHRFKHLKDIFVLSDMMDLIGLKLLVTKKIVELIGNDNWNEILTLGWRYEDASLKSAGFNFVAENWEDVRISDNMCKILEDHNIDLIQEIMAAGIRSENTLKWSS
jgi:hypothetical protein